jgi:hypothetical protein
LATRLATAEVEPAGTVIVLVCVAGDRLLTCHCSTSSTVSGATGALDSVTVALIAPPTYDADGATLRAATVIEASLGAATMFTLAGRLITAPAAVRPWTVTGPGSAVSDAAMESRRCVSWELIQLAVTP